MLHLQLCVDAKNPVVQEPLKSCLVKIETCKAGAKNIHKIFIKYYPVLNNSIVMPVENTQLADSIFANNRGLLHPSFHTHTPHFFMVIVLNNRQVVRGFENVVFCACVVLKD